jgi:formylglycine-generating enzyme required for sulfatase activity
MKIKTLVAMAIALQLATQSQASFGQDATVPESAVTVEAPVAAAPFSGLIDLVPIPAGSFQMGNATTGDQNERPVHQVTVGAFLIARTETTRAQYQALGFTPPAKAKAAEKEPVAKLSWLEALAFCNALSAREGLEPVYTMKGKKAEANFSKNGYRLPTEAEWEYAARSAGIDRLDYAGSNMAGEVSWHNENSNRTVQPVAAKAPNSLGLHDMSGNVWEWCWDIFAKYTTKAQVDPVGPEPSKSSSFRIIRGGSVNYNDSSSRVGFRMARDPETRQFDIGFRVARRMP